MYSILFETKHRGAFTEITVSHIIYLLRIRSHGYMGRTRSRRHCSEVFKVKYQMLYLAESIESCNLFMDVCSKYRNYIYIHN